MARKTVYVRGKVKGTNRVLAAELIDDVSAKDLLAQAFGVKPTDVTGPSGPQSGLPRWFRDAPEKKTVQFKYKVVSK